MELIFWTVGKESLDTTQVYFVEKCKHVNPYNLLRLRHSTQDRTVFSLERAPNS